MEVTGLLKVSQVYLAERTIDFFLHDKPSKPEFCEARNAAHVEIS